jgi:hypothetical protein
VINPQGPSPPPPSSSFIGEVGEEVLFSPYGEVVLTKTPLEATTLMGFVFTKISLKATNGPQISFCEP